MILIVGFFLYIGLAIWSAVDAYRSAKTTNLLNSVGANVMLFSSR
jgi:hypothetical protein